jgi:F0F1-type ATP synthase alpha subunit
MLYRESNLNFYTPTKVSYKFNNQGYSYQHSPLFSPKNAKLKKQRPYLIQNGITHYNIFEKKQQTYCESSRTPLNFYNPHSIYLKSPPQKETHFLPKLKTLKVNLRSKSYYQEKRVHTEKSLKDENTGTDD